MTEQRLAGINHLSWSTSNVEVLIAPLTFQRKKEIIEMVKSGSAMAWRHIYFHGVYDFSEEKLTDSFNLAQFQNRPLDLVHILES